MKTDQLLCFTEKIIKKNFNSYNSKTSDIEIVKTVTNDSLKTVTLNLKFNDINDLNSAVSFQKIKASRTESNNIRKFKYTLMADTANAKKNDMNKYKLVYEFTFPGEILISNGDIKNNSVRWVFTIADLYRDRYLTAKIKVD